MLTPPAVPPVWSIRLTLAERTAPRRIVAALPGAEVIVKRALEYFPQTRTGRSNVPARQMTIGRVSRFSTRAIPVSTDVEVAPVAESNGRSHRGRPPGADPSGVAALGIRPSPSTGTAPRGLVGRSEAVTGGPGKASRAEAGTGVATGDEAGTGVATGDAATTPTSATDEGVRRRSLGAKGRRTATS